MASSLTSKEIADTVDESLCEWFRLNPEFHQLKEEYKMLSYLNKVRTPTCVHVSGRRGRARAACSLFIFGYVSRALFFSPHLSLEIDDCVNPISPIFFLNVQAAACIQDAWRKWKYPWRGAKDPFHEWVCHGDPFKSPPTEVLSCLAWRVQRAWRRRAERKRRRIAKVCLVFFAACASRIR